MENDEIETQIEPKKRKTNESESENVPKTKKARLYSVKEFRKQLITGNKLSALKEFLSAIKESSKHDYVHDYLKNGGTCLELLQTLEGDSSIPPTLVFELVTLILLKISAGNYGQYYGGAQESCRYLINNYLPVVHKMLGLSSSKEERKACLKLLTSMAAFSPSLAKDILINVKFHSANIELLTKHTGEKNSVRDHFLQFITAFLVDSDSHTLSILLEKSGLLTSIMSGLQYDVSDTVCLVITAMKNHILENPGVRKTTKMHVFNTAVVKDMVNLYNWKGPQGLKAAEKGNKTVFEVDKVAKSKVSESVHDFLLVLCTLHKFGVIFRDPLVGLGRKNQNGLMYTVLDSLDRPWEHSYASELVIKICRACPDLTKNVWTILKPFLEPRLTNKWLIAMNFVKRLLNELEPTCIEYCVKDLNPQQLAQIIEVLVSPAPILKILFPDGAIYENSETTQHISVIIFYMLDKIGTYLESVKNWTSQDNFKQIKRYLSLYVSKNYPSAENVLKHWQNLYFEENKITDDGIKETKYDYLETILDILSLYKNLAPQLLYNLTSSALDLKDFLLKLSTSTSDGDNEDTLEMLQMKIVGIFVDIDHSYFLPKTEIFTHVFPLLLKLYHKVKSKDVQEVLHKLLSHTDIFESSKYEINIWLNAIFNLSTINDEFGHSFVDIVRFISENILLYQKELSLINIHDTSTSNESIIENLLNISELSYQPVKKVKHRHISPFILGFLRHLKEQGVNKYMKKYLELVMLNLFHSQTSTQKFYAIIQNYKDIIPGYIFEYMENWTRGKCEPLRKFKGALVSLKEFSELFFVGSFDSNNFGEIPYPDFHLDLLRTGVFCFGNLVSFGLVEENHANNFRAIVEYMIKEKMLDDMYMETILSDPNLVNGFDVVSFGKKNSRSICTESLFEVVKRLKGSGKNIEEFLEIYTNNVFKVLIKAEKCNFGKSIGEILEVFPLSYVQCVNILTRVLEMANKDYDLVEILTYCLARISTLCRNNGDLEPVSGTIITNLSNFMVFLCNQQKNCSELSRALKIYLEVFPHSVKDIDDNLFDSVLNLNEYGKENVDLLIFLFERDSELIKQIEDNIESISDKKGVILPLTHALVNCDSREEVLKKIYDSLESSIIKALQKPQKVGQHFLKNYDIAPLIEKFMAQDKCAEFTKKVQKFEVTEVFHAKLLEACFNKTLASKDVAQKQIENMVLTFVHLLMTLFKRNSNTEEDGSKMSETGRVFNNLLDRIIPEFKSFEFKNVAANETFKNLCKFLLKFGVSGQHVLLRILTNLVKCLTNCIEKEHACLLLNMLLSHSEFLNVVLNEHSETKFEVLTLFLTICENWEELMEKSHVAVILSAYRGMVTKCDRTILAMLKLYESKAQQTRFYDFKPFLWGRAAATHYSVRTQIDSALTRQPKTSDVLGILKEDIVNYTISHYHLTEGLHQESNLEVEDSRIYDLKFLLPLFSHILAPEQQVKTFVFTRSGALSLTVVGLSSHDKDIRQAACHVLSRFHFHLEARQTGKDNLLWIRYVEALCIAVLPNLKLNNFAAIFFARMASILTNPKHVMYTPLSLYLTAKQHLDLSTVPELYTLLFSPHVNYKEHRVFILEVLRDGLRTEKDFFDFLKSMGLKLFLELFSSCLSDDDTRNVVLEVIYSACKISLGVKILCENYSLLSQLCTLVSIQLIEKKYSASIFPKVLNILLEIVNARKDSYTNQTVYDILLSVLNDDLFLTLKANELHIFFKVLYTIYTQTPSVFRNKDGLLNVLIERSDDRFCKYLRTYGCKYVSEKSVNMQENDKFYYLRLLILKM